ncbi:unnamed protein product [Arabis nemorensis]|uniref:Uncharacterized protein n=1 Tax=Arabis nemorensis TaxID=586526 RepID=A0A565C9I5_9BRAS|nr:unnamed protein product [Arabis nemorensis]
MNATVRPNAPRRRFRGAFHPPASFIILVTSVGHCHRRDLPSKLCLGNLRHSLSASIDSDETLESDENFERFDRTLCRLIPDLHKLLFSNQSQSFPSDSLPLKGRRSRSHPRALSSRLKLVPLILLNFVPSVNAGDPTQVSNLLGPQPSRSDFVERMHLLSPTLVHSPDRLLILTVTSPSSQSTASNTAPSMARDRVADEPPPSPQTFLWCCHIYTTRREQGQRLSWEKHFNRSSDNWMSRFSREYRPDLLHTVATTIGDLASRRVLSISRRSMTSGLGPFRMCYQGTH